MGYTTPGPRFHTIYMLYESLTGKGFRTSLAPKGLTCKNRGISQELIKDRFTAGKKSIPPPALVTSPAGDKIKHGPADLIVFVWICEANRRRSEDATANTRHPPNVETMLGRRRRRWINIGPALGGCLVLAVMLHWLQWLFSLNKWLSIGRLADKSSLLLRCEMTLWQKSRTYDRAVRSCLSLVCSHLKAVVFLAQSHQRVCYENQIIWIFRKAAGVMLRVVVGWLLPFL